MQAGLIVLTCESFVQHRLGEELILGLWDLIAAEQTALQLRVLIGSELHDGLAGVPGLRCHQEILPCLIQMLQVCKREEQCVGVILKRMDMFTVLVAGQ